MQRVSMMNIVRLLLIIYSLVYVEGAAAEKFTPQSAQERIDSAAFIGLIAIEEGKKIDANKFAYLAEVIDLIKENKTITSSTKVSFLSNCALAINKKYLIYAFNRLGTSNLVSNCINDPLFEVEKDIKTFQLILSVPEYMKSSLPIINSNFELGCVASLSGVCFGGSESLLLQYQDVKSDILKSIQSSKD